MTAPECWKDCHPEDVIREAENEVRSALATLVAIEALRNNDNEYVAWWDGTALDLLAGRLDALSPLKVLARGYSVTLTGKGVLRRATDVVPGDALRTILAEGEIKSRVE